MIMQVSLLSILGMLFTLCISVALPVVVMLVARKKLPGKMLPVLIGAGTFTVSALLLEQILHTVMILVFGEKLTGNVWIYALYGGLAAGVFEETARYFAMKLFMKKTLNKQNAIMYGIGHGGAECILLIGMTYVSNLIITLMINLGLTDLLTASVPADQKALALQQLSALWTTPSYEFFLAGFERVLAFALQICLSYIVYRSLRKRNIGWLFLALGIHFFVDAAIVLLSRFFTPIVAELGLLAMVASVAIVVILLYRKEKAEKNTIVFDVDGTLLNTERIYVSSWSKAGPKFGYEIPVELPLSLRGVSAAGAKKKFLEVYGADFPFEGVRNERIRISEEEIRTIRPEDILMPGVIETLEELKKRGYKMAVASSTEQAITVDHLERFGLAKYFSAAVGGDMVKRGKPAPDIFQKAALLSGAFPDECYAVGDSPSDVRSALAAGMEMILIPDLAVTSDDLKAKCLAVLDRFPELTDVIK